MLRALGQDQNLPPLQIGVDDLPDDAGRTSVIDRQCPEDLLDSGVGMHDDRCRQEARRHLQRLRCTFRLRRGVPDRTALHEDDRLLTVAPYWSSRQAEHVLGRPHLSGPV